jgi:hypothetical protein
MHDLSAGTVTLFFTDIEDSTRLLQPIRRGGFCRGVGSRTQYESGTNPAQPDLLRINAAIAFMKLAYHILGEPDPAIGIDVDANADTMQGRAE